MAAGRKRSPSATCSSSTACPGEPGSSFELPALLLVDGDDVTSDAEALAKVTVTAEVVDHTKGPKIVIQKFKNKTGYKKRQGHRQRLTQVQITGIDTGSSKKPKKTRPTPTSPDSPLDTDQHAPSTDVSTRKQVSRDGSQEGRVIHAQRS